MQNSGVPTGARRSEDNRRLLEVENPRLAAEGLWAHATPRPEAGGLLIASLEAADILGDDTLWQVVIFLTTHGPEGSVGVMLNKPTTMVLGRKQGGLSFTLQGAESVQAVFGDNRVYCGGTTAQQIIHIMHGHRGMPGATQIVPGIYMGGEHAAAQEVQSGAMPVDEFKFFAGAMTWGPGQLEEEISRGAWYTAACSRSLVLKPSIRLPVPLWREVLLLLGGQYSGVAKDGYEGDE